MPSGRSRRHPQGGVALFCNPDDRHGRARDRVVLDDRHALIEGEFRAHAPRLERRSRRPRAGADGLLIMPGNDQNGPARLETLSGQRFGRLHQADEARLVVHGPSPPDGAVLDLPAEGRSLPLIERLLRHGHHVLVRHQDDRRERRIRARPGVDQRAAADDLPGRLGVERGVGRGEPDAEIVPGLGIILRRILMRHGLEADRLGQVLRRLDGVHLWRWRKRNSHGAFRRHRQGAPDKHSGEHSQNAHAAQNDRSDLHFPVPVPADAPP